MLKIIIEREILDNLLNIRFVAATVVSTLLVVVSVIVLTGSYKNNLADYNGRQSAQEDFIRQYGHLNRFGWMAVPQRGPAPYAFLVSGIDWEAEQQNFISDPLPGLFNQIDLVVIVTIIMSLMAILFSYNAISGEREGGLLKLMLSNGVSRSTIIMGKFIGGSISVIIPFTAGILAGLAYVSMNPSIRMQTADIGVFCLLLFASYLYISSFYALGLLFSARSQTSNMAVLQSLFAWVILVLMLPNISPFLAARIYRVPSKTKIDKETHYIRNEERDQRVNAGSAELLKTKYADIAADLGNSDAVKAKTENDPAFRERYNAYQKDWMAMVNAINAEQIEKTRPIWDDYTARAEFQEALAADLASLSPVANYVFIATDLTGAGIRADMEWNTQVARYNLSMGPVVEAIYNKAVEKNPSLTVNDHLDLREMPRFQFQPQDLREKIGFALPHCGMLVLFNLLFLGGGIVSFWKYDVR